MIELCYREIADVYIFLKLLPMVSRLGISDGIVLRPSC